MGLVVCMNCGGRLGCVCAGGGLEREREPDTYEWGHYCKFLSFARQLSAHLNSCPGSFFQSRQAYKTDHPFWVFQVWDFWCTP